MLPLGVSKGQLYHMIPHLLYLATQLLHLLHLVDGALTLRMHNHEGLVGSNIVGMIENCTIGG